MAAVANFVDTETLKELNSSIDKATGEHLRDRIINNLEPSATHVGVVVRRHRKQQKVLVSLVLSLKNHDTPVIGGLTWLPALRVADLPTGLMADELVEACRQATRDYIAALKDEARFLEQGLAEIDQLTSEPPKER
jgi:hypothetical protein